MALKESSILHENGNYWVMQDGRGYHVMVAGATHSVSESSYADPSLAIARVDYLAQRAASEATLKNEKRPR